MIKRSYLIFVSFLFFLLLLPILDSFSSPSTGILIPLYIYPENDSWKPIIDVKRNHPDLPIVAIINPNNGPGFFLDEQYQKNIVKLDESGITMLGYVATGWAEKPIDTVKSEIDSWMKLYPSIHGVFFDEMSTTVGNESYYSELSNYASSKHGLDFTVGNPGTVTNPKYLGTVDNIVIHENSFLPDLNTLSAHYSKFDKQNFSVLVYDQETIDANFLRQLSHQASLVYVTHDKIEPPFDDHDPWETISIHMETMAQTLDVPEFSINIFSQDVFADSILSNNENIVIKHEKILVRSGIMPLLFTGIKGQNYELSVSNFSNYTFVFWENGLTDKTRTITLQDDHELHAVYDNNTSGKILPVSRAIVEFNTSKCFLINHFGILEDTSCNVNAVISPNGNVFVVFDGFVESKHKHTKVFSSQKNDFPFVCAWESAAGALYKTLDWKQITLPDGNAKMICKFTT